MPAGVDLDLAGGPDRPAGPADRRGARESCSRTCARPRSAAADLAAQVGGEPARGASASRELARSRLEREAVRRGDRLRASAARARRSPRCRTAATRRRARSRATVSDVDLPIRVAVTVAGDAIEIDFDGHLAGGAGNVNAPLAVTRAACTFAVKVALGADVPVNAGSPRRSRSARPRAAS